MPTAREEQWQTAFIGQPAFLSFLNKPGKPLWYTESYWRDPWSDAAHLFFTYHSKIAYLPLSPALHLSLLGHLFLLSIRSYQAGPERINESMELPSKDGEEQLDKMQ